MTNLCPLLQFGATALLRGARRRTRAEEEREEEEGVGDEREHDVIDELGRKDRPHLLRANRAISYGQRLSGARRTFKD